MNTKTLKRLYLLLTVVCLLFAVKFLSIEDYTTETLLTAFLFLCVAIGCVIAFGIESDKTNK